MMNNHSRSSALFPLPLWGRVPRPRGGRGCLGSIAWGAAETAPSPRPSPRGGGGRSVLAALALFVTASVALAQDQPSLDDLLDLTPAPAPQQPATPDQPAAPTPPDAPAAVPVDDEVARMLRGEQPGDVFEQAVAEMGSVAERLAVAHDTGVDTQRAQEEIIAKLDRVIAMAKDQQMGQSGSSGSSGQSPNAQESGSGQNAGQGQGQQPGEGQNGEGQGQGQGQQPGGEGSESNGDGGGGAAAREAQLNRTLEESRSEWGNLPPRLRDEVMEGVREKFSPVYRELTEAYYRRLAEEGR